MFAFSVRLGNRACSLLVFSFLLMAGGPLAFAQTPVGDDAPDDERWVEVEVPVEMVNRARKAAGRDLVSAKAGGTVTMRYQRPVEREQGFHLDKRPSRLPLTSTGPSASNAAQTSDGVRVIEGIDFDENGTMTGTFNIPADPHGAVGSNHLCHVVNTSIQCHDKADGSSVLKAGLDDFFSHDSGTNLFDPRVVYDPRAERWVVLVLNRVDDGTAANDASELFLAASDGSDPEGSWTRQTIDMKQTIDGTDCWFDYPGLALDEEAIYVTGTYFPFKSQSQTEPCDTYLAIFDQDIYSGPSSTRTYLGDPNKDYSGGDFDGTLQPAFIYGSTPDSEVGTWVIQYSGLSGSGDEFWLMTRIDYPHNQDGSRSFTNELVSWGDVDDTGEPSLPNAPQPDVADEIETNDRRALDLVWRNDELWGTTTVLPPTGETDAGQATAFYGQIDVSTLGGPVPGANDFLGGEDVETGAHTYFPSVAVDASGNAAFGFSLSGSNTYAGAYLVTRPSSGGLSSTKLARDGVDSYFRNFGGGQNRWGDYSGVEIDPSDGSVWTINKVALAEASNCSSDCGRWGTFLTKFASSALPVELANFTAVADGESAIVTWETTSESNNAGFRIEHQGPEHSTWIEKAFVDGQGTTSTSQQYRHRVSDLGPGVHQFRLVQVDDDGAAAKKGPIEVAIRPEGRYALRDPRPNPTSGEARLQLSVRDAQTVRVALYNTLGQKVRTLTRTSVRPTSPLSVRVDGSGLASGVYFVRVEGETFTTSRKLTLTR